MVELKTQGEIEAMRAAGKIVADALAAVREQAGAGVPLTELDQVAREVLAEAGATSPFLGYQPGFASTPFPAVICTSVNDAALHGIPTSYRLADGDLLSVDCGAVLDGWAGDAAISLTIGVPRPADLRLIETGQEALRAGIAAAVAGARMGDVSAAIGAIGRAHGCGAQAGHKFPGQQGGRRSARLPAGQLGPAGRLTISRAGWLVGYLGRRMTVTFHAGCTSAQLAMCRPG